MELSIIVMVYNVAPYIERCLDSLLNQDLKDYEIIIVNDGSTDLTQPIIDRYVASYEHIHSVITSGIGVGPARDYGLKFSKSDYFLFIDGDDYMKEGALGIMLEKLKEDDGDIAICDSQYFSDNSKETYVKTCARKVTDDIKRNLILGDIHITAKIFKSSFWKENNISFMSSFHADLLVALKTTFLAKRFVYIEEPYYMRKEGKATKGIWEFLYIFPILEDIYSFFSANGLLEEYYDELEFFYVERLLINGSQSLLDNDEDYRQFMNETYKMMNQFFPKYTKNKYLKTLLTKNQRALLRREKKLAKAFL